MIHDPSRIGATTNGAPYAISQGDRRRHFFVVGQTGTGKSALLLNLIAQDLAKGRGVALIDPHGDVAEAALALIPPRRAHQLVYLNPADLERPVSYNVLDGVPEDRRATIADDVVAALRHVWPDSWGPRMEHILRNALRALLDVPGSTLLGVSRLLADDAYRTRVVRQIRDPVVRSFWLDEYAGYDRRFLAEANSPILNKLGRVLSSPAIRNILSQPKSTMSLRRVMDEGRILIVNLAKGAIGEGNAQLLGALLISGIAQAALSRVDSPEADRRVFHLYADEFQNFATQSFAVILSEARKYALGLTLASQQVGGQLSDTLRQAVLGNVGSVVSFRLGAEDAPLIASHIGLKNPDAIKDLPNFHTWSRFLSDGAPSDPIRLRTFSPPPAVEHRTGSLIANSRIRFGPPRHEVESRIAHFVSRKFRPPQVRGQQPFQDPSQWL